MLFLMTLIAFFADGVVFESRPLEYQAWRWAFHQQGRDLTQEEYKTFIGLDKQELIQHLYDTYGCTWDPEVIDLQAWEYSNMFSKGITLKEGVADLIKKLPTCYLITSRTEGLNYCPIQFTGVTDQLDNYVYLTDSGVMAKKLKSMGYHVFGLRTPWTANDDFSSCIKVFDSIAEIEPQELWLE